MNTVTDTLSVKADLDDANGYFMDAVDFFVDLRGILDDISKKLQDARWAGLAHDHCNDIHSFIQMYSNSIEMISCDTKSATEVFTNEIGDFKNTSQTVKNIENW